jgi:hypothetical protein
VIRMVVVLIFFFLVKSDFEWGSFFRSSLFCFEIRVAKFSAAIDCRIVNVAIVELKTKTLPQRKFLQS